MTKKRPPNVSYYSDRQGTIRWRYRKKGRPESQTRAMFGSPEWWTWYQLADQAKPPPVGSSRTKPGSIDALAVAYYASGEWGALRPNTQVTYRGILDRFRGAQPKSKRWGDLPAAEVDSKFIRRAMDAMASRPHAANNMLKVLRALFRFAVDREWRTDNPTQWCCQSNGNSSPLRGVRAGEGIPMRRASSTRPGLPSVGLYMSLC